MSFPTSFSQAWPPAPTFDPDRDIVDLTGKVAIVTGGYSGIGYETVKALLKKNCKVYIFGRNQQLFDRSLDNLANDGVTQRPHFINLDLGSYSSIGAATASFLSTETVLDYLFNSAGVMVPPVNSVTAEGVDLQFGTNVVGHWLLTMRLLPALQQAKLVHGQRARVVFTASSAADMFPPNGAIDFDSIKVREDGSVGNGLGIWALYGQSKIGDVIVANEFNRRYGDTIVFSSCNPGNLNTNLGRNIFGENWFGRMSQAFFGRLVAHPAWKGALTQLYAATSPETEDKGGTYFVPWARVGKAARPEAEDEEVAKRLWDWLERECEGKY